MVPLIQRLLDVLNELEPAPHTAAAALRDLLRSLAAQGIQDDPAAAAIPPGDWPAAVVDAIEEGAERASALTAEGVSLHVGIEELPLATPTGQVTDGPSATIGPFVDRTGRLLRFTEYLSPALIAVVARPLVSPDETVLMIPFGSTPADGDDRTWELPAGSVWIRSRFLVAGAPAFTGLRIAGGSLRLTGTVLREGQRIVLSGISSWTLSVEPEQPAAAELSGSDADALSITLPQRLVVHASAQPDVTGDASLSGFGSDLTFARGGGPPFVAGGLLLFPLALTVDPAWTIVGNRSGAVQFSGRATVESPMWALPQSTIGVGEITRAPHGGSLVMRLTGKIESDVASQSGPPFVWFVSTLTANGRRVELDGLQVAPGGRDEIELWPKAESSFTFAQQGIARLLFRSERAAGDAVAILGGVQRNRWDHPRKSDGQPFDFEGRIDIFGLVGSTSGFVLASRARADRSQTTAGLALENLYLVVRPPRQCALVCAFVPAESAGPEGVAILFFDSDFALPTLPDPYATNADIPARDIADIAVDESVRVALRWAAATAPIVTVHLDRPLSFPRPQPAPVRDEDEERVYNTFRGFLDAERDRLYLLDVSSREHLFGVSLDVPDDRSQTISENRFAMPLHRVRLFMQPQVHWEAVWTLPNERVPTLKEGFARSLWNGGPTLVGARSDDIVPTLPARLSRTLMDAIKANRRAAAVFSLPFGLRAMARLSPDEAMLQVLPQAVDTSIHEPDFGDVRSARQIRLSARTLQRAGAPDDPARTMPGMLRQLNNLDNHAPAQGINASNLNSVLPAALRDAFNQQFEDRIPLHHADLSGYGLSTFSEWRLHAESGVTKAHFEVLNGRTAYEVIQFRSVLYECGSHVVRTITIERRNSAAVILTDSGWVSIDDGLFNKPQKFETGAVLAFRNIRRIRITGEAFDIAAGVAVQPVIFDADLAIDGLERGGAGTTAPILDRPGYVQVKPLTPLLTPAQLQALFTKVGPIASAVDCGVRIGATLAMELGSIVSDTALGNNANDLGFAVAAVGSPKLPRAGQWTAVRIDPVTTEAVPVDPRRGVPVVRNGAQPYVFREPSDARRTQAKVRYGLLMSTQGSRVLFPQPRIDPGQAKRIAFDPPFLADPYSLVQSTTAFPRAAFALKLVEAPTFDVPSDHTWKIQNPAFTFTDPAKDLLKGGEWAMARGYDHVASIQLDVDSAAPTPWNVVIPPSTLDVDFPMLPDGLRKIFQIRTNYVAESGGLPTLAKPTLEFIGALKDVKEIIDTLSHLADLGFDFDVNVVAGSGASPSFLVQMQLIFRIGSPSERFDIGVGKFFGQFLIQGNLEVATTGVDRPRLFMEFQGDIQQGIIPPLLYAGGLFRFGITIPETGRPVVQLAMGVVASIGGDLIPGLLEVEVTVKYGYTLIPETLQPGVLLGLEARAKLLAGLVGFSFGVEAMARIKRLDDDGVTIWAQIRVAATVQIAIFIEEEVDFETQFEQKLPLELAAFIPGVGLLGLVPALARA